MFSFLSIKLFLSRQYRRYVKLSRQYRSNSPNHKYSQPVASNPRTRFYLLSALLASMLIGTTFYIFNQAFQNEPIASNDLQEDFFNQVDESHLTTVSVVQNDGESTNSTLLGLVQNPEDLAKKEEGFKLYSFNSLISERIGLTREVPDTRHALCRDKSYPEVTSVVDQPEKILDTTVIICFYNEEYWTLLRTVYSLLQRTEPAKLLKEILLVDDSSDSKFGVFKRIFCNEVVVSQMVSNKSSMISIKTYLNLFNMEKPAEWKMRFSYQKFVTFVLQRDLV